MTGQATAHEITIGDDTRRRVTLDACPTFGRRYGVSSEHLRRLPLVEDGRVVATVAVDDQITDVASDLANLLRPVVGEVIFGHPEPTFPAKTS